METHELYRIAVDLLGGMADAARATDTPYRTVQDRYHGERGVTVEAARIMGATCRDRAMRLWETADGLAAEADRRQEERDHA